MRVKVFFDLNRSKIQNLFSSIKLECEDEIKEKNYNKKQLRRFFIKKMIKKPKRVFNVLTGKELNIPYFEFVLTTVCNLNCQGCSALMDRYEHPKHIDVNDNLKALKRLLSGVDSIRSLRLLGGEPMCYPYLYEVLDFVSKEDKIKEAVIVTNGSFVINDDKVIEVLKNKKFFFSISVYDGVEEKRNKLIQQLEENDINYIPMSNDYSWIDYGGFDKRNRSEKQLKRQFNKCQRRRRSILNGKVFQCYRCSHATNLGLIDLRDEDYVDLFDENISSKDLKKKLYRFVYKYTKYIESCNYCDCTDGFKKIKRGVQTPRGIKKNDIKKEKLDIKVGDVITYIPPFDEGKGIGIYMWDNVLSSSTEDGKILINNKDSDFRIINWKVLRINDDTVDLVPCNITEGKLKMQGPQGYNNSVFLLNEFCSKLYGDESHNIKARSINVQDIENIVEIAGKKGKLDVLKNNTLDYNKQLEKKSNGNNVWYPTIFEFEKNNGIEPNEMLLDLNDSTNEPIGRKDYEAIDEGKKRSENGLRPYKSYYNTKNFSNTKKILNNFKSKYSKILLPKEDRTQYWVASRCIGFGEECVHYDVRLMYNGFLRAFRMYASDDIAGEEEHSVFPIVSVKHEFIKSKIVNNMEKEYYIDNGKDIVV